MGKTMIVDIKKAMEEAAGSAVELLPNGEVRISESLESLCSHVSELIAEVAEGDELLGSISAALDPIKHAYDADQIVPGRLFPELITRIVADNESLRAQLREAEGERDALRARAACDYMHVGNFCNKCGWSSPPEPAPEEVTYDSFQEFAKDPKNRDFIRSVIAPCDISIASAPDEGGECLAAGCVKGTIGSEHLVSHGAGCPNGAKEGE